MDAEPEAGDAAVTAGAPTNKENVSAEAEAEADAKAQAEPEGEADAEAQAEPEAKVETEAEAEAEATAEAEPEAIAEAETPDDADAAQEPAAQEPAPEEPAAQEPAAQNAAAQDASKPETTAPAGHRGFKRAWTLTAAAAAVVVAVGATIAATSGSKPGALADVTPKSHPAQQHPAPALHLVSVTPADGATDVNGGAPITVTFDGKLAPDSPMPTLSPKISGTWQAQGDQAVFKPATGYQPHTRVTVSIPAGMQSAAGLQAGKGGLLAAKTTDKFSTGGYSTLRMQQLLAQLGYLPLDWAASDGTTIASDDANAQLQAAYSPPQGSFTFQQGYPSALTDQWHAGKSNELVTGAVMAFQSDHNLTMDGIAGPQVWRTLLKAVTNNQRNPHGYTYAYVNQNTPQRLKVWHNGKQVLDTLANTGIPGRVTDDGTYPVYLRYNVTQMRGLNPDGTKYDDTVYWVSYFNGSDAIHYFPRGSYGWSQSLGCVEIQWGPAKNIWPMLTYGTLVTVTGPPGG